ncbi:SGNH/GDSL hydrolase family protein [Nocardioides sp. B-3]|uniref:SGNH/GDSL hydrolase family protein n=1 Tax=Nocardioides sp. B-3 TaxID=2895565 RepID=UPI0021525B6A|nr:SGNH/GDSL hydrolase family protein [Nocardioides sp. B-3]UUZ61445.1 SGNH/GDSL hydrolase family protein [Nocardioides sp. B-3]
MILRPSLHHVLVVLLAAVLIAVFFTTTRARGSDAALCARHAVDAAARARIVTGAGVPVTVIGDSWTVGLGLPDPGRSWPSSLPARVRVAGFSGSGFSRGASHCGDHAFATRAPAARGAGLVIVAGGLNDFDQPTADIRAGFRSLIASLGSRPVVVVGPASAPSRAASVERVNTTLASLSEEYGVAFIDTSAWALSYLPDRLHLSAAGHAAYGQRVADELAARGLLG